MGHNNRFQPASNPGMDAVPVEPSLETLLLCEESTICAISYHGQSSFEPAYHLLTGTQAKPWHPVMLDTLATISELVERGDLQMTGAVSDVVWRDLINSSI